MKAAASLNADCATSPQLNKPMLFAVNHGSHCPEETRVAQSARSHRKPTMNTEGLVPWATQEAPGEGVVGALANPVALVPQSRGPCLGNRMPSSWLSIS